MHELESLVEILATVCHEEGIAVIAVNGRGNVSYWSSGARDVFGHAPNAVLGRPIASLAPRAACLLADLTGSAARGGFPPPLDLPMNRNDGTPVSVRLRAVPVGGIGEGCVVTARV